MALTFTLVDTWDDGKRIHVCGTVTASGNYTTGGDALDPETHWIFRSIQLFPPRSRRLLERDGWTGSRDTTTCLLPGRR
jgi:hypothetical protein